MSYWPTYPTKPQNASPFWPGSNVVKSQGNVFTSWQEGHSIMATDIDIQRWLLRQMPAKKPGPNVSVAPRHYRPRAVDL